MEHYARSSVLAVRTICVLTNLGPPKMTYPAKFATALLVLSVASGLTATAHAKPIGDYKKMSPSMEQCKGGYQKSYSKDMRWSKSKFKKSCKKMMHNSMKHDGMKHDGMMKGDGKMKDGMMKKDKM
jgi:hypothetical protein